MASIYLQATESYQMLLTRQPVLQESSAGPEGSEWESLDLGRGGGGN